MDELEPLDITPETHFLDSTRNSRFGWKRSLRELVDNSFDGNADCIEIRKSRRTLEIADDGCGSSDLQAFFRLGTHVRKKSTKLGRYGVGLKEAAIWLWGRTTISTSDGKYIRSVNVCWDEVRRSGKWHSGRPTIEEASKESCRDATLLAISGTVVLFRDIEKPFKGFDDAIDDLGYTFHPALSSGKQIRVIEGKKRRRIKPFQRPELSHLIDRTMDLQIGKELQPRNVRIVAGVVPEGGANPFGGFNICYEHRCIMNTSDPCRDFSSARFFSWVYLQEPWPLTKNKDDLGDKEELFSLLYETCYDVLKAAHDARDSIELKELEEELTGLVKSYVRGQNGKKRTRRTGTEQGEPRVTPADPNRKPRKPVQHVSSVSEKPGDFIPLTTGSRVLIDYVTGQEEIAIAELGRQIRVKLSRDHPGIVRARENRDLLKAIVITSICIVAATEECKTKGTKYTGSLIRGGPTREAFLKQYTEFLNSQFEETVLVD